MNLLGTWAAEKSGPHMILVVKRHARRQQELARNANGRIIWFESLADAEAHADRLNGATPPTEREAK